jgi:alkanesulfonate monooxygenase
MPVEFIGFIGNHHSSEIIPRGGPVVDPHYIATVAKAHEYAGFDRALLAFHADAPDPLVIGQYAASVTERLGIFIAYRTSFVAPTVLARQFATLDQLSKGRISFNVITGAEEKELARDGNLVADKDERYARTNEYLDVAPRMDEPRAVHVPRQILSGRERLLAGEAV